MADNFTPYNIIKTPNYLTDKARDNLLKEGYKGRFFDTGDGIRVIDSNEYPKSKGWVNPDRPNEINLNSLYKGGPPVSDIFVHELQHIKDYKKTNSSKSSWADSYVTDKTRDYDILFGNASATYAKYQRKYNLSDDYVSKGLIPELARIESGLPVGMNIFDTDIGKEISNNLPAFRMAYFHQTAPTKGTYMYSQETADAGKQKYK